ncbi:hypothetical protein AN958_09574 [Leucoagaricus sp. SymC.cos]|nr:hypothetical protein AN958_09574 [Leucoagaricus sp. SymC.cos]
MLTRTLISFLTLGAFALAQSSENTIPAGNYHLELHWEDEGQQKITYAYNNDGTVWSGQTNKDTWFIEAVDPTGEGYTIQNVASKQYAQGSVTENTPIELSGTKSLWAFNATIPKASLPGPFTIHDIRADTLVWTAKEVDEDDMVRSFLPPLGLG